MLKTLRSKNKIIFSMSVLFLVLSLVARLYVSGKSALAVTELKKLYTQREIVQAQIEQLKYYDLTLSSISNVTPRATALGFVPINKALVTIDITVSAPLALK